MVPRAGRSDEPDAAFEALFRREVGPIGRTAFLIVGDWEVAREVVQDTFVQVLRHWEKVSEMESPGGWARRVAIRKAIRVRRRDARRISFLRAITAPATTESEPDGVDVHDAVLSLPAQQRAAITLYYLEDRPVHEIATLMGCGEVTVRTHLARGRKALAASLGEELDDEPR